jgi:lysosomal acid lipase/cholesteryl ester hydrolase
MNCYLFVFVYFVILLDTNVLCQYTRDPDSHLTTCELIKSRGFQCEQHFLETSDGYILGIQRIVNPLLQEKGRPVLLWHGLLSSSRDFVINDPFGFLNDTSKVTDNNLGFLLSKRGYDVWLGNTRGNTYSRNHTTLNPEKDKKFWNFSYDEMISIDQPETIDYILKLTGRSSVSYIGHSQGTLIMFGVLSSIPKYNSLVKPFIALAPVTSVDESSSPLTHLAYVKPLLSIVRAYNGPFLPSNKLIKFVAKHVCRSKGPDLCTNLIFLICGFDYAQWNQTRIPVYISQLPAGTSSKNMIHFSQNVKSGLFRKYDYGHFQNWRRYKSLHPPKYDLANITNKEIALFSSMNDWLATPANVDRIRIGLKVKLLEDYVIPFYDWNHLDYLFALNAGRFVNERIVHLLSKYDK